MCVCGESGGLDIYIYIYTSIYIYIFLYTAHSTAAHSMMEGSMEVKVLKVCATDIYSKCQENENERTIKSMSHNESNCSSSLFSLPCLSLVSPLSLSVHNSIQVALSKHPKLHEN